jgi:hypothetical protein
MQVPKKREHLVVFVVASVFIPAAVVIAFGIVMTRLKQL